MSSPLTKDNNKDYEHIEVTKAGLVKKGIKGEPRESGWSFGSSSLEKNQKVNRSNVIPGLRCPDCAHCAHTTDVPNVATCCHPNGWFFFYRRLDQDVSSKAKLVIRNGEMVLEEGQDKSESGF